MKELKFLKDLSRDELKALYNNNNGFSNVVYDAALEQQAFISNIVFQDVFGERPEGFRIHDHYDSYYFALSDVEELCKTLDEREQGVLSEPLEQKIGKLLEERDAWEALDPDEVDEDVLDKTYNELEVHGKEVLAEIEGELHDIEDDISIDEVLEEIRAGEVGWSDWQTDGKVVVYQTTTTLR